jgi:hypothetical protein
MLELNSQGDGIKKWGQQDMVAQVCNPSYSEGRDWRDHCSRPAQAKCYPDPISTNKPGIVVCVCNPSYSRGSHRSSQFEASIRQKHEILPKK